MTPGDGDSLIPTAQGKRIGFDGADRTLIDGPFGGSTGNVVGLRAPNREGPREAALGVKLGPTRCPAPAGSSG
jgi:hypothetical protein